MDDDGIALAGVPGATNSSDERRDNAATKTPPVDVDEIDPAVEKRLRRKLDRRVVGILFLLYLVAFLDRSNIGNAQTAGMGKDLEFDDGQFQVRGGRSRGRRMKLIKAVAPHHFLHPLQ